MTEPQPHLTALDPRIERRPAAGEKHYPAGASDFEAGEQVRRTEQPPESPAGAEDAAPPSASLQGWLEPMTPEEWEARFAALRAQAAKPRTWWQPELGDEYPDYDPEAFRWALIPDHGRDSGQRQVKVLDSRDISEWEP